MLRSIPLSCLGRAVDLQGGLVARLDRGFQQTRPTSLYSIYLRTHTTGVDSLLRHGVWVRGSIHIQLPARTKLWTRLTRLSLLSLELSLRLRSSRSSRSSLSGHMPSTRISRTHVYTRVRTTHDVWARICTRPVYPEPVDRLDRYGYVTV